MDMDLSDAENQTLLEDLISKLGGSQPTSDWQQQTDAQSGTPYYWNAKVCGPTVLCVVLSAAAA
jgi:hypothetical protein